MLGQLCYKYMFTVIWGLVLKAHMYNDMVLLHESSQSYILVYITICIAHMVKMSVLMMIW